MSDVLRVLFVADSHLGLDLPVKPRVERRRRGDDFLANHRASLEPALNGEADLVVHGGDVFHMPGVAPAIAHRAYAPLLRVAERGVPVVIVPGNHERGRLPHARLLTHPRVHVFDRPRTFVLDVRGVTVALAGFPFERRNVRTRFPDLLRQIGLAGAQADVRLLCIHHCVEGATVGPADFTFTTSSDVIRGRDIPADVDAVLSGHIHRHQVLTRDLAGRPLAAPVLYPGSIERTSTAEIGETKGFLMLSVASQARARARVAWEFRPLHARPMFVHRLRTGAPDGTELDAGLRAVIAAAPPDAVLCIRVEGDVTPAHRRAMSATHVRSLAPADLNIDIVPPPGVRPIRARTPHRATSPAAHQARSAPSGPAVPAAARKTLHPRDENLMLDL